MKYQTPELFIGITCWNSELFLPICLQAIHDMTRGVNFRIVVLDNSSTDNSTTLAYNFGAEVVVEACSQADALNRLVYMSDAPYTLLLHSDVVLLDSHWFDLCRSKIDTKTILISPEDIGCGPYTRPFGIGMPESSFLFAATDALCKTRIVQWTSWHRLSIPRRCIDFYGNHITHRLPQRLRECGYTWYPMLVHTSDVVPEPIYNPCFAVPIWSEELAYLRYGLGNFYSIDGVITHYHNWYERVDMDVEPTSQRTTGYDGTGFPVAYIKVYTQTFLRDHAAGTLILPQALKTERVPKAL